MNPEYQKMLEDQRVAEEAKAKAGATNVNVDVSPVVNVDNGEAVLPTDTETFGEELSKSDASRLEAANEAAAGVQEMRALLTNMQGYLPNMSFDTGALGNVKGLGARLASEFGTFNEEAIDYDVFVADASKLGSLGLAAFGGNDSNRELIVSLKTVPNINYRPEANMRILGRSLLATEVALMTPDLMAEFIEDTSTSKRVGSLSHTHPSGVKFQEWLKGKQGEIWDSYKAENPDLFQDYDPTKPQPKKGVEKAAQPEAQDSSNPFDQFD